MFGHIAQWTNTSWHSILVSGDEVVASELASPTSLQHSGAQGLCFLHFCGPWGALDTVVLCDCSLDEK